MFYSVFFLSIFEYHINNMVHEYGNSVQLHIKGPWYYYLIPSLHPGASQYFFVKVFGHLDLFTGE